MKKEVRIVVVGDAQTGKTSLIISLISASFQEQVVPVVPTVTIPPEMASDNVTTHIIDTSSKHFPEMEVMEADSICIVYADDKPESLQRVQDYWIPEISRLRKSASKEALRKIPPIILVGNRIDTRQTLESHGNELEKKIQPIMDQFKEVETCVECSAKMLQNVQEVFYFAQKAVVYPTAVLFDAKEGKFTEKCSLALRRIFKLSDKDKDDSLSDSELEQFQQKCFGTPLSPEDLMEVKQTIREQTPGGLNKKDYLTVLGFFRLHHLFIEKGKWETPWKVLRRFHYDDELELEEAFLCPELDLNDDQTVELNAEGDRFFRELFKSFDKDQDGALSPAELSRLFETSPGQPWDEKFPKWTTATDAHGYVNLQGFLSQWNMTTLLDYKVTLRYLAYLGYEDVSETGDARDDTTRAISIMQGRKVDLKAKRTDRTVFQCFVFGAPRSGKSTFLNGLINAPYSDTYSPTMESRSVVNMVINERYLVLREFSDENQAILSEDLMKTCDLACLLYDGHDPNSFSYAAKIQQQLGKRVPIMFVCTKSDLALVKQNHPITPEQLCESLRIPLPKAVSFVKRAEDPAEIYQALQQRIMMTYENGGSHIWLVIVGIGLAAGIIAGGVYYRSKR